MDLNDVPIVSLIKALNGGPKEQPATTVTPEVKPDSNHQPESTPLPEPVDHTPATNDESNTGNDTGDNVGDDLNYDEAMMLFDFNLLDD